MTIDGVKVKKITVLKDGQKYNCKKGLLTSGEVVFNYKVGLKMHLNYRTNRTSSGFEMWLHCTATIPKGSGAEMYTRDFTFTETETAHTFYNYGQYKDATGSVSTSYGDRLFYDLHTGESTDLIFPAE